MDAIIMEHNNSPLLRKLQRDFPHFSFRPGDMFRWSPQEKTIYYPPDSFSKSELLHELGHATLGHSAYTLDIELLQIEREAWEHAQQILGQKYKVAIPEDVIEEAMDTYREWLHARSLCVTCGHTGLHTKTGTYQCLNCRCQWRANEARICLLRRYKIA